MNQHAESDYEFIDGLLSDLLSHSAMPNADKFAREQFEHLKTRRQLRRRANPHLEERFTELSKQSDTTKNIAAEETAERRLRYRNQLQARNRRHSRSRRSRSRGTQLYANTTKPRTSSG